MNFTALFPFCGLGAGALGFLQARVELFGVEYGFRSLGGIDCDADACRDFEYLTGSPALCADISSLSVDELRAFAGVDAPDVVFSSPPCKGFSGLLGKEKSKAPKYEALNQLVVQWTKLMLAAWEIPPKLVLIENVPRIETRGKSLLAEVKKLLGAAGYVFHAGTHDCGEVGGLAQRRKRFLLVARHTKAVPSLLYQPPRKRVRGCGEVLETLPLPGDPGAGPLHKLPKISLLNWIRLALIPPGGDWRDLPPSLDGGFRYANQCVVLDRENPARTITGALRVGAGALSIADRRLEGLATFETRGYPHTYGVLAWKLPAHTVTGGMVSPGTGPCSIGDPRLAPERSCRGGVYGVLSWGNPFGTITGETSPTNGRFSVADPRLTCAPRETSGAYGLLAWKFPAKTVTGSLQIDNGFAAVADPRVPGSPSLRVRWIARDLRSTPPFALVLPTRDGTWHRPLTTLELAALQGLPTTINGSPLILAGNSASAWRERIGNAVPVGAAAAIARQMLLTLGAAVIGSGTLSTDAVWVEKAQVLQ